ncbi:MAG: hypothetical protein ACOX0Y_03005 [Thiopseudomonas sp.]
MQSGFFVALLPATLDSAGPLAYTFGHVLLVVDRQHAQALYVMTASAEMGAHTVELTFNLSLWRKISFRQD